MPEIDIAADRKGRSEFIFKPLPGETLSGLLRTALYVSTAASYIKSYRRVEDAVEAVEYREKAENVLTRVLPQATAKELIQALLDNKIGTKAVFTFRGYIEVEGFTLKSLEIPGE